MGIVISYNIIYGGSNHVEVCGINSYWENGKDDIYSVEDLYSWYIRRQSAIRILAPPSRIICRCGSEMQLGRTDLLICILGCQYRLLRYFSNDRGLTLIDFIKN